VMQCKLKVQCGIQRKRRERKQEGKECTISERPVGHGIEYVPFIAGSPVSGLHGSQRTLSRLSLVTVIVSSESGWDDRCGNCEGKDKARIDSPLLFEVRNWDESGTVFTAPGNGAAACSK
jgi:hypothetical protein